MDRASGSGPGGCRFESCRDRHYRGRLAVGRQALTLETLVRAQASVPLALNRHPPHPPRPSVRPSSQTVPPSLAQPRPGSPCRGYLPSDHNAQPPACSSSCRMAPPRAVGQVCRAGGSGACAALWVAQAEEQRPGQGAAVQAVRGEGLCDGGDRGGPHQAAVEGREDGGGESAAGLPRVPRGEDEARVEGRSKAVPGKVSAVNRVGSMKKVSRKSILSLAEEVRVW